MLFQNNGEDESGSGSEDELHIFFEDDGANDISLFYLGID